MQKPVLPDPREILGEVANRQHPNLPPELLDQVYRIQREHQFDEDPQAAVDSVRRLVEGWVAQEAKRREENE